MHFCVSTPVPDPPRSLLCLGLLASIPQLVGARRAAHLPCLDRWPTHISTRLDLELWPWKAACRIGPSETASMYIFALLPPAPHRSSQSRHHRPSQPSEPHPPKPQSGALARESSLPPRTLKAQAAIFRLAVFTKGEGSQRLPGRCNERGTEGLSGEFGSILDKLEGMSREVRVIGGQIDGKGPTHRVHRIKYTISSFSRQSSVWYWRTSMPSLFFRWLVKVLISRLLSTGVSSHSSPTNPKMVEGGMVTGARPKFSIATSASWRAPPTVVTCIMTLYRAQV